MSGHHSDFRRELLEWLILKRRTTYDQSFAEFRERRFMTDHGEMSMEDIERHNLECLMDPEKVSSLLMHTAKPESADPDWLRSAAIDLAYDAIVLKVAETMLEELEAEEGGSDGESTL